MTIKRVKKKEAVKWQKKKKFYPWVPYADRKTVARRMSDEKPEKRKKSTVFFYPPRRPRKRSDLPAPDPVYRERARGGTARGKRVRRRRRRRRPRTEHRRELNFKWRSAGRLLWERTCLWVFIAPAAASVASAASGKLSTLGRPAGGGPDVRTRLVPVLGRCLPSCRRRRRRRRKRRETASGPARRGRNERRNGRTRLFGERGNRAGALLPLGPFDTKPSAKRGTSESCR